MAYGNATGKIPSSGGFQRFEQTFLRLLFRQYGFHFGFLNNFGLTIDFHYRGRTSIACPFATATIAFLYPCLIATPFPRLFVLDGI